MVGVIHFLAEQGLDIYKLHIDNNCCLFHSNLHHPNHILHCCSDHRNNCRLSMEDIHNQVVVGMGVMEVKGRVEVLVFVLEFQVLLDNLHLNGMVDQTHLDRHMPKQK